MRESPDVSVWTQSTRWYSGGIEECAMRHHVLLTLAPSIVIGVVVFLWLELHRAGQPAPAR